MAKNKSKISLIALSDEDYPTLERFYNKTKPNFYLAAKSEENRSHWGFPALPAWVVIDKKGIVRHVQMGAGSVTESILDKAIMLSKQ